MAKTERQSAALPRGVSPNLRAPCALRVRFAILLVAMATSSITANIEIKDPAAARAFVDALLSTEPWPQPKPTVYANYFASDEEAHSFFRRSPYAQKVGVR